MERIDGVGPNLAEENRDADSPDLNRCVENLWNEIFDSDSGRIREDLANIIETHKKNFEDFRGRHISIHADDLVYYAPWNTATEGVEIALIPARPAHIDGEFLNLATVDADELPRWNRVYGRPVGNIPGFQLLSPATRDGEDASQYFVPLFSVRSTSVYNEEAV